MPRYVTNKEIDRQRWDECIENSAAGNIYGFTWYLDLVCENWDAIIEDDYSAVLPLPCRRKYLIDYIYPPFFTQQPGIYSLSVPDKKLCVSFLNAIPAKFQFIEMNLTVANKWFPESFSARELPDLMLHLGEPYSEIRKHYSENHERNIRKAEKNSLKLFRNASVNDVITMFRNNRGQFVKNLKEKNYRDFSALTAAVAAKKSCRVWTVSDQNGIPCAGAVFFESHRTGIFIFSGITAEGRKLSAMHFLIDQYIQEMSMKLKTLDFEGSSDPDLARFYRGFGALEFLYLQIRKNTLPAPWKWLKK